MQEYYGHPFHVDGLTNIRLGVDGLKVAFEFKFTDKCQCCSEVSEVIFFNAYDLDPLKPGYSGGNGGTVKVAIHRSEDGKPSPLELTSAVITEPLRKSKFLRVKFDQDVVLDTPSSYFLVFSNVGTSPQTNYTSVNVMALADYGQSRTNRMVQPLPLRWTGVGNVMIWNKFVNYGQWEVFKPWLSTLPIFTLFNSSNQVTHPGYGGMEVWIRDYKVITGGLSVCQNFIPSSEFKSVGLVRLRAAVLGTPSSLYCELREGFLEPVIGRGIVKTSEFSTAIRPTGKDYFVGGGWVEFNFGQTLKLKSGERYTLSFSTTDNTPQGEGYVVWPARIGGAFGFSDMWGTNMGAVVADVSGAQTPWIAYGKPNGQGCLQTYIL